MRLLIVGTAPETGRLARSLVLAGSGSIVHCRWEGEALRLLRAAIRFDWLLAEAGAVPTLADQIGALGRPLPRITYLDWSREPVVGSNGSPAAAPGAELPGLVREGESPWVLEYHVPRGRGSLA